MWPDWAIFQQFGYFWRLIMILCKVEVAQNNGYFLFKKIYYIFILRSSFKTWFVVGILRFQKWFDVGVLGFQIELCCRYFGLFCLGYFLGYSLKNIFWSPWFYLSSINEKFRLLKVFSVSAM